MMNEMIRYGGRKYTAEGRWDFKEDKEGKAVLEVVCSAPKNTMVTVRDGERIFFGIARCNKKDTFSKERGKEIARFRLQAALKELDTEENCDGQSGLYGVTTNVEGLLDYFHNDLGNVSFGSDKDEFADITGV